MLLNQDLVGFSFDLQKDPAQKRRVEDAIIAWTWYINIKKPTYLNHCMNTKKTRVEFLILRKTFLENISDPTVLLRMPMTKAAVRVMVKSCLNYNYDLYLAYENPI